MDLHDIKQQLSAKIVPATISAITVFVMAKQMGVDSSSAILFFLVGYLAKSVLD